MRLQHFPLTREQPCTVVFIADPERTPPRLARLHQLYGFTAAEGRVAQLLVGGASVDEAASTLNVKVSTVRSQLRLLLHEMGAKSLPDLMRRLGRLAPVN